MTKPIKNIAASNRAKLLYISRQTGQSFQELVQREKQKQWTAFCRKRNVAIAPMDFSIIASEVLSFIKPLIERAAGIDSTNKQ